MTINYYAIQSNLTNEPVIEKERNKLIKGLEDELSINFKETSLEELKTGSLALILVESGGSEEKFLKILDKLSEPVYLLTYGANNSLAASLEILSYLRRYGYRGEVLHGSVKEIASRIKELLEKNKPSKDLRRLGVIGEPSDWLISSKVNYDKAKERLNLELVNIDINEVIKLYNAMDIDDLETPSFTADYDKKELQKAFALELVLENIIEKYDLSGLTIRCFALLDTLKTTACLALALLNAKGITSACEGDVATMLSMDVIKTSLDLPSFQVNPCFINKDKNEIILAHCTLPLSMCESYKFDTHYESNIGVGIKGELKEGDVTILKIAPELDSYFVSNACLVENLNRKDLCRTQVKLFLDKDVNYFLTSSLGNHHLICYGHHADELKKFLDSKGFKEVEY